MRKSRQRRSQAKVVELVAVNEAVFAESNDRVNSELNRQEKNYAKKQSPRFISHYHFFNLMKLFFFSLNSLISLVPEFPMILF